MNSEMNRAQGAIITKPNTRNLYIKTYFFGESFEVTTGMHDTPENRVKVDGFLKKVMAEHYNGELNFSKAFPGAKPEKKLWYAVKSSQLYTLLPQDVYVAPFIEEMKESFFPNIKNKSKRTDYLNAINARVLPFFKNSKLTFADINVDCMQQLADSFFKKDGAPLTWSRISKIILALRTVITFAESRYGWGRLQDPFWVIKMIAEVAEAKDTTRVLLYDEFQRILTALNELSPWYRQIVELMVLTGMIPSELAGLKPKAIRGNYIYVETYIINDTEKKQGKSPFRTRKIRITTSIRRVLDELNCRRQGNHLVTMEDGKPFSAEKFRKDVWTPALLRAGIAYEKPYCLRHTFIGWALLVEKPPYELCGLTGHKNKRMIYEVYGEYRDGIEADRSGIDDYFGADFVGGDSVKHKAM